MELPNDLALPFLLMSAFRGLVETVHDDLAAAGFPGIHARHGFAMQAIGQGCTGVELANRLGVSKQAATRTAEALEAMGLITREQHPDDLRARVLLPTDRGRQMLARSAESFTRQLGSLRAKVGDEAVDTTLATLASIEHGARGVLDISHWQ